MANNEGSFRSTGVTQVLTLPAASNSLQGMIFYLRQQDGLNDPGFYVIEDGPVWAPLGGSAGGSGGSPSIYIYDVQPQPSETGKSVSAEVESSQGHVREESTSNTNLVRVWVRATGGSQYLPVANVDGEPVTFAIDTPGPEFNGYADLNIGAATGASYSVTVVADHDDGPKDESIINVEFGPEISNLVFANQPSPTLSPSIYPEFTANSTTVTQTEVKENDTIYVQIQTTGPDVTDVEFAASGVLNGIIDVDLSSWPGVVENVAGSDYTIPLQLSRTDVDLGLVNISARAAKADGAYGDSATSANQINFNNRYPTISIDSVDYPVGTYTQEAIKNAETADVNITTTYDDAGINPIFSTTPAEVLWQGTPTLSSATVVGQSSGIYNTVTDNITVQLFRSSNGRTASDTFNVQIADVAPAITVTEPGRLISSPTGFDTEITIDSGIQDLLQAPSVDAEVGTFQGGGFTGSGGTWTRDLRILDTDSKGVKNWSNLSAVNLAGIEVTTISGDATYEIGGFASRQITFTPAFSNEHPIGTSVGNTANLVAADQGPTTFTYQNAFTDTQFTFTITDGAGALDPNGTHIWVTDTNWINQNSTGTAFITIGETA